MTILEARDIIAAAQNQAMFKDQQEELQKILKSVNGIITDLDSTVNKAIKKAKHKKKAVDPSLKFSAEYEISKGFENHLKTLSILVNAQEWTSNLLQKVNIEADRKDEYIQLNVGQTAAFVDGLHDDVCGNISDLVLDGERKQWIATVIGFFIDFVLLIFYAVARWAPAIDETINVDDALAGFISAVASVVTLAITTVVVFSINRYNINKFNKTHTIKYKELVRASSRNEFKKSIMLMSFGEDLKEAKEEHTKIIENTNKLLEFSLSSEKMLNAIGQKADWQLQKLEEAKNNIIAQKDEIMRLQAEVKTAQEELEQHDENAIKELKGVKNQLEETKVELEKAELGRTLLKSKLDNANGMLKDLKANLSEAKAQAAQDSAGLKNQLQEADQKIDRLEGKAKDLEQKLLSAKEKARVERKQYADDAAAAAKEHTAKLTEARVEIAMQREKISTLTEKIEGIKCDLSNKEAELTTAAEREQQQKQEIAELNAKLTKMQKSLNDAQQQNNTMFHEVKEQIADINGARSWSCRVCYSANNIGDSKCSVCGASRTIAKDQIDEVRHDHEPEKYEGTYWSSAAFVCVPKNYASGALRFDSEVKYRNKIIFVPQEIKTIDLNSLMPGLSKSEAERITIRKESGETKITGNQYHVNVEGKPDEIK